MNENKHNSTNNFCRGEEFNQQALSDRRLFLKFLAEHPETKRRHGIVKVISARKGDRRTKLFTGLQLRERQAKIAPAAVSTQTA